MMKISDNMQKFSGFIEPLKGSVALFGVNDLSVALLEKYPEKCVTLVCFDAEEKKLVYPQLPIISVDDYMANPANNMVITDEPLKFEYLETIYRFMYDKGVTFLENVPVWYDYSHYYPKLYDCQYRETEQNLPVECSIPVDSKIRIIDCIRTIEPLDGDVLELGTGYGGSTYFIADTLRRLKSKKHITTIDRFERTPYLPGLSVDLVREKLAEFSNIRIVKGDFLNSLKTLDMKKISFCFWDAYATPDTLPYVYPKIVPAGILLIDNYIHGCTTNWGKPLADLFFRDKPEKIIRIGNTQGMMIKQKN